MSPSVIWVTAKSMDSNNADTYISLSVNRVLLSCEEILENLHLLDACFIMMRRNNVQAFRVL